MSNKKANINIPLNVNESDLDFSKMFLYDVYYVYVIPKWR